MMENKVLLILIDGLRPDALAQCEHPFLYRFMKDSSAHSFNGRSVMPSITLPCHMSLFHSVTPDRHGILDNTYIRPTHKLDGLFDILERQKKKCAFFYTWAQLRDLCRPGALARVPAAGPVPSRCPGPGGVLQLLQIRRSGGLRDVRPHHPLPEGGEA